MEKKHPSLPPNYVTIADLKQRWLKQKQQQQKEEEEAEQKERHKEEAEKRERQRFQDPQKQQQGEEEKQHQRCEPVAVVRTRSAYGTRNVKQMQFRSKIRTDSGTNSRWIAVTRDGNAELDNKGKQSKKMKKKIKSVKKRNPKVEEKEKVTREESESEISEAKKSTIESGLIEVEKNVKQNPDVKVEKKENEAIEESENSEAKKSTSETELNGEKKDDSILEEVEEKFGGLSVNAGNEKQVWRNKRVNEGFGHSQPERTNEYYFGGRGHRFSRRYGGFGRHNDKGKKVVWVRKGGNDNAGGGESGEIEA